MKAILVIILTLGLCYGLDKGFAKLFRGKVQHSTGLAVRVNKRYATAGILLCVLGIAAIVVGLGESAVLIWGGGFIIVMGIAMIVYYLSFGVFYDEDSLIVSGFGKPSRTYYFREIKNQQLYNSYGNIVIELYFYDGKSVQLHRGMTGVDEFMDAAFAGWLQQRGKTVQDCPFHDPDNSCWFPPVED